MDIIRWQDAYSVHIAMIDEQHKKLIAILNELADAMSAGHGPDVLGRVLTELNDYTVYHFSTEEELFRQHGYPDRDAHKQQHDVLTGRVKQLKQEFDGGNWMLTIDTLKFLSTWLNDHIIREDHKYAPFLNSKGVV